MMRWAGHEARMREMRIAYKILAGKPEGKWQLGRPRYRCKDVRLWTGCMWLRSGANGGLSWKWKWTIGFHKGRWISWTAERIL